MTRLEGTERRYQNQGTSRLVMLFRILLFFAVLAGSICMIFAGVEMTGIHSQGSITGNTTVAELYYNAMGMGLIGLGIVTGGIGALLTFRA